MSSLEEKLENFSSIIFSFTGQVLEAYWGALHPAKINNNSNKSLTLNKEKFRESDSRIVENSI